MTGDRLPYIVLARGAAVDLLHAPDFSAACALARLCYGPHAVVSSAHANPYLGYVAHQRAVEADACEVVTLTAYATARARRRAA